MRPSPSAAGRHPLCAPIEHAESLDVAQFRSRYLAMQRVGEPGLLHAGIDWDDLFASASPPGAPSPDVARASYTRIAFREHHERQRHRRTSAFVKGFLGSSGGRPFVRSGRSS